MNTEKIIEELERENAFLRHEIWMDGEKMDDLEMINKGLRKQVKELSWKLDVLYRMIDSLTRRIHEIKKVC
ncbi:hypothetical protein [Acidaminococcus intestini]|jgi:cell division protein FtsB|uniref:hypothetical protein n=1 Tax=Acidaminococcus intestini TaxID=187327 RepID=UPI00204916E7|nr:hypothetical protein [Acidaminococcus intestini]DAP59538.1 MAG TPA: cell division protein [Caudoviricetes sp.]